jgi:hypothetical protein
VFWHSSGPLEKTIQWKIISINSVEVDFSGVKAVVVRMLKNSSEKLNFIPKKKRNERQRRRKSKIFRLPFLISQQKRLFDQNSFTIQMSLGVLQSDGNESRKI